MVAALALMFRPTPAAGGKADAGGNDEVGGQAVPVADNSMDMERVGGGGTNRGG